MDNKEKQQLLDFKKRRLQRLKENFEGMTANYAEKDLMLEWIFELRKEIEILEKELKKD